MPRTLTHLTLNTGHSNLSPRDEVEQATIDYLLTKFPHGGPIDPMPGWHLAFLDEGRPEGAAFFQFSREPGLSHTPVIMCLLGWGEGAAQGWHDFTTTYELLRQHPLLLPWSKPAPKREPPRPWLAVELTASIADVPAETVSTFGDLERCVAWTVLQRAGYPGA